MKTKTKNIFELLNQYQCCVVIPTYNNAKTLSDVVNGVLKYTKNIIVVNDGCTDNTSDILKNFSELEIITLQKNKGKGNALYIALKKAEELNFEYAITIDSDGQHYPDDIPLFVNELDEYKNKDLLLIGARNLNADGMPRGNTFANKFSNFWYWVETGEKLLDTQSGFRLYPLKKVNSLQLFTTRYEFEIEVIVKSSWASVDVKNIPIRVLYQDDRVSHFRPYKDFLRITLLNTYLVLVALLYVKPRDLFRRIKKKGLKKFLIEDLLVSKDSNLKKSLSISLGTFIGISPFWGFQSFLSIFLAQVLNLNKAISFTFSNVSIPPFIPFIIYGSLRLGGFLLNKKFTLNFNDISENFNVKTHLLQYLVGSFTLAVIFAMLFGIIGYGLLIVSKKKK